MKPIYNMVGGQAISGKIKWPKSFTIVMLDQEDDNLLITLLKQLPGFPTASFEYDNGKRFRPLISAVDRAN
jgi:hypothetical protein